MGPLQDRLGRIHTDLRISVTDRCNVRCTYCMPAEQAVFMPRHEILSFEEIVRFAEAAADLGVRSIRLTGGEPLLRKDLPVLARMLAAVPGIESLALTTNGTLLAGQAQALREAGVRRINISLDALSAEKFTKITRRAGFEQVLAGISAAQAAGFERVKVNAVALKGLSEEEVIPFGHFARRHDLEVRFIEVMPLDADGRWEPGQVLTGGEIRGILEREFGPLHPVPHRDASQPATDYRFGDGLGRVGFIHTVSAPFCQSCNRLRLTAEGKIRNCLFSVQEWDARGLLRGGGSREQLADLIRQAVWEKKLGRGSDTGEFVRPERAMYQIGG